MANKLKKPCKRRTMKKCRNAPRSCKTAKGTRRGPYCRKRTNTFSNRVKKLFS